MFFVPFVATSSSEQARHICFSHRKHKRHKGIPKRALRLWWLFFSPLTFDPEFLEPVLQCSKRETEKFR